MYRYEVGRKLGEGTFGTVSLAVNKSSGEKRAIKRLKDAFTWDNALDLRELRVFLQLPIHPNITQLYELCREKDSSVHLVFEYMPDGSLHDWMQQRTTNGMGPLPGDEIAHLIQQILNGLRHMHKYRLVHRDIKPENILLCGRVCKVADFSLVRSCHETSMLTTYVSTRWYRAPEVILASPRYSYPVDIFATGCLAAELYQMRPLFPGHDEVDQIRRIFQMTGPPLSVGWIEGAALLEKSSIASSFSNDFHRTEALRAYPRRCAHLHMCRFLGLDENNLTGEQELKVDFLLGVLSLDPSKRLKAQEALDHPFFASASAEMPLDHNNVGQSFSPSRTPTIGTLSSQNRNASQLVTVSPTGVHDVDHNARSRMLLEAARDK